MFVKSAAFYDALYHFKDYGDACTRLHRLIQSERPGAATLLDVGCGTGKHLSYLREWYDAEGTDLSAELLQVARGRCPDVPFHQGDMVDFTISRSFDVVTCLFSAIAYVRSAERMRRAVANMARHLNDGGLLVIEPWFFPETVRSGHLTSNYTDLPDLKIAWMYKTELANGVTSLDIHYLVGSTDGVSHFKELHELGVFSREEYMDAFSSAGLSVSHDPVGLFSRGLFVGRKGAGGRSAAMPATSESAG